MTGRARAVFTVTVRLDQVDGGTAQPTAALQEALQDQLDTVQLEVGDAVYGLTVHSAEPADRASTAVVNTALGDPEPILRRRP